MSDFPKALTCAAALVAVACAQSIRQEAVAPETARTAVEVQRVDGGVVRGPVSARRIALVFTGHEFAEGAPVILDTLARHRARASFFLTGVFLRSANYASLVRRLVREEHYVGPRTSRSAALLLTALDYYP